MACLNNMPVVLIIIAAGMIIGTANKAIEVEEHRQAMGLSTDQYDFNYGKCLPSQDCKQCHACLSCKDNEMSVCSTINGDVFSCKCYQIPEA